MQAASGMARTRKKPESDVQEGLPGASVEYFEMEQRPALVAPECLEELERSCAIVALRKEMQQVFNVLLEGTDKERGREVGRLQRDLSPCHCRGRRGGHERGVHVTEQSVLGVWPKACDMSPLLRRTSKVACFYCNSPQLPRSPQSFQCSEGACWNRYDTHGEIISDDPAMHDENLNAPSFAKRGSPIISISTQVSYLLNSFPQKRPSAQRVRPGLVLPHLPNKSNAHSKPPLKLPPFPRRTSLVSPSHSSLPLPPARTRNTPDARSSSPPTDNRSKHATLPYATTLSQP